MKGLLTKKSGIAISIIWIIVLPIILSCLGYKTPQEWNEWGDFLAGLFAPLAFTWLVAGYYLQAEELRNSIDEMKIANATNHQQTQSITDNTNHTKRDVFFTLADFLIKEMHKCVIEMTSQIINSLYRSCFASGRNGNGHGDIENLCVQFAQWLESQQAADTEEFKKYIREHRGEASVMRYRFFYEKLIAQCRLVDVDNNLTSIYEQSTLGQIYRLLPQLQSDT